MRALIALALLASLAKPPQARADEPTITLKPGPGLAEITTACSGCHSLDYVRMNAPFLSPDAWKAEVTKMRVAFGAPVDEEDQAKILAYLTANYGPPG
jgi:mono/diheme cytochrome c family protein